MKTEQRISIIIPAYNEERHLAACLDAVAKQTVKPYEVFVVDNNSSDDTAKIARSYPFVTLLREPKQGIVFARNTGFNAARGDIIARVDADTIMPPQWVKAIADYYAEPAHDHSAWTAGAQFYNVRLPRLVAATYNFLVFDMNRVFMGTYALWGSSMALPVAIWKAVCTDVHIQNDIHEDLDLAIHLRRHHVPIRYQRHIHVTAKLRRVRSNRHELWQYLQMWPRTLRIHGLWSWVLCWLIGGVLLYAAVPVLSLAEYFARLFGKESLQD